MFEFFSKHRQLLPADQTLPGREHPLDIDPIHAVYGNDMTAMPATNEAVIVFGMGCYWGAEKSFWSIGGVVTTAVGFAGGHTPNPTYRESCGGRTNHAESVRIVYRPEEVSLEALLAHFWESHDPTQGMRQGNDVGTEYRSAIFVADQHELDLAVASRDRYQRALSAAGYGTITTEISINATFYFAETYHQQYLHKNPGGYCGLGGTGVGCPVGLGA